MLADSFVQLLLAFALFGSRRRGSLGQEQPYISSIVSHKMEERS